jgi:hypothetical protein
LARVVFFPRAGFARSAAFFLADFFTDTFLPRVVFFFVFFATVFARIPLWRIPIQAELYTLPAPVRDEPSPKVSAAIRDVFIRLGGGPGVSGDSVENYFAWL